MTGFNQVSAFPLRVERSGFAVRNGLPIEMIESFELIDSRMPLGIVAYLSQAKAPAGVEAPDATRPTSAQGRL